MAKELFFLVGKNVRRKRKLFFIQSNFQFSAIFQPLARGRESHISPIGGLETVSLRPNPLQNSCFRPGFNFNHYVFSRCVENSQRSVCELFRGRARAAATTKCMSELDEKSKVYNGKVRERKEHKK